MEEQIKQKIREFSKGNEDLATVLTIFASALVVVLLKVIIEMNSEKVEQVSKNLLEEYDKRVSNPSVT